MVDLTKAEAEVNRLGACGTPTRSHVHENAAPVKREPEQQGQTFDELEVQQVENKNQTFTAPEPPSHEENNVLHVIEEHDAKSTETTSHAEAVGEQSSRGNGQEVATTPSRNASGQRISANVPSSVECSRPQLSSHVASTSAAATETVEDSSSSSSSSGESLPLLPEDILVSPQRAGPRKVQPPAAPEDGDARVGLLYDESMELHVGPEYPAHMEVPTRIIQLYATLEQEDLMQRCWQLVPRMATDEELLRVHSQEHLDKIHSIYDNRPEEKAQEAYVREGADLYVCKDTSRAARYAAGCCVQAVEAVLNGTVNTALAVVRPPGHHAECDRAMGFCFFNNCCVAARAALQHEGIKRVAILDWDVHHGNGIQQVLWEDPNVLYISIHRDPTKFYPYHWGFLGEVGEGAGRGFNVNIPWIRRGMGDAEYAAAFELVVEPILQSFNPDMVIVAAGFDAAEGDPLGGCKLSPRGYAHMTQRLLRYGQGRLVLALEGGYNSRIMSECAAACVRTLLGESVPSPGRDGDPSRRWPQGEAVKTLRLVSKVQAELWPVLADPPFEQRYQEYQLSLEMGNRRITNS